MMGKNLNFAHWFKSLLILTCLALWGCVQPQPDKSLAVTSPPPVPEAQKAAAAKPAPSQREPVRQTKPAQPVAMASTVLQNTDCTKCHNNEPEAIKQNGGLHKTEIGCLDCHTEHPPVGTQAIPQCSMCHEPDNSPHYILANCNGCHQNPHTPLNISVENSAAVTTGCNTCHGDKGEELKQFPSKHTKLNCTECHPSNHKKIDNCLVCHEPHAEFMAYQDCLRCHKPHSPRDIKYADDTPSRDCGACHGELEEMLAKNQSRHQTLKCAYCHKTRHPTVPNCRECHPNAHDRGLLKSFNSDCLKCHGNPHDLVY